MKIGAILLSVAIAVAQENTEEAVPVQIVTTQFSGSGCPQSSPPPITSLDSIIQLGPLTGLTASLGGPQADGNKNCQLHVNIRYPEGYQASVRLEKVSGSASFSDGVQGSFIAQTYFSQAASKTVSQTNPFELA
jgi:hypothetical protein